MLDFLDDIGTGLSGILNNASPVLSSIEGLVNSVRGISGRNEVYNTNVGSGPSYEDVLNEVINQGPTEPEMRVRDLLEASLDPNHPLVKQMQEQDMRDNLSSFLAQIRGLQMADRRVQARGGQPTFFSPERADETVNFLTTRGLPKLQQMAKNTALDRISNSAGQFASIINPAISRQGNRLSAMQTDAIRQILQGQSQNRPAPAGINIPQTSKIGSYIDSAQSILGGVQGLFNSLNNIGNKNDSWMDDAVNYGTFGEY